MRQLSTILTFKLLQQWPLVLCLGLLVVSTTFIDNHHFVQQHLIDSSHAFIFFLSCLISLNLLNNDRWQVVILVILFWTGVGLLIELVQPYVGRDRSKLDLLYDGYGCAIAGVMFWMQRTKTRFSWLYSMVLLFPVLAIPSMKAIQLHQQHASFPALFSFNKTNEENFWRLDWKTDAHYTNAVKNDRLADGILKLSMKGGRYPGISFQDFPSNWQGYNYLNLTLYSDAPESLTIRVNDKQHNNQYHDRFNKTLTISSGVTNIAIPLTEIASGPKDRRMDLNAIASFKLFIVDPDSPVEIYLDEIWLH